MVESKICLLYNEIYADGTVIGEVIRILDNADISYYHVPSGVKSHDYFTEEVMMIMALRFNRLVKMIPCIYID